MVNRGALGALLIAAPVALVVTLLGLANLLLAPRYEPSSQVSVDFRQRGGERMYLAGSNKLEAEERRMLAAATMRAADSRRVAEETIRRLGLEMSPDELLNNLKVEQGKRINLVTLSYEGTDRKQSTRIVNTLGEVTSQVISEGDAAGRRVTASVDEARVPRKPPEPRPLRNGLVTLVVVWGLLAGSTLALVAVLRR